LDKRFKRLGWAAIVLVPVIFFLGVEGAVRLFGVSPAFERDAAVPPWMDRNILVKDARWMELLSASPGDLKNYYSTYQWDRYLFYRLKPDLSIPLTDVLAPPGIRERTRWVLKTNGKGFPGPEIPYGPHPGIYRIVTMGDSSTFGWGVETEEAYPMVLLDILRRRHPGMNIEVVNMGVCGYSSLQGKIMMEREGLKYAPDLVTLSYGSNDWSRVPEPFDVLYRRNAGWVGGLQSLLHHSRAYEIYAALLMSWMRPDKPETPKRSGDDAAWLPFNVGPAKSRSNQIELVNEVRAAGADPILVTQCVPGRMARPSREAAEATGTPLLDSEAVMRARIPDLQEGRLLAPERARVLALYGPDRLAAYPDLEVYLADRCHPNVVGHQLVADALAAEVERAPSFRRASGIGGL